MKCPKCNKRINKSSTQCKFCSTLLVKEEIEILIELPKLKEIPLKVKKVVKPKKDKLLESIDERKKDFLSSLIVIIIMMLLVCILVLINNMHNEIQKTKKSIFETSSTRLDIELLTNWITEEKEVFSFYKNETFKWTLKGYTGISNFYEGTYTTKRGTQALAEMGISLDELELQLNKKVDLDYIYSMKLLPTKAIFNNQNVTNKKIGLNETWWFILIIEDEQNAIAYNKTLDKRYVLSK